MGLALHQEEVTGGIGQRKQQNLIDQVSALSHPFPSLDLFFFFHTRKLWAKHCWGLFLCQPSVILGELKQKEFGVLKQLSWLSVQLLVSAQIMISWFTGWSLTWGSVLTVQSLLGVLLSLSLCPSPAHVLSLSLSLSKQINKLKKNREFAVTFIILVLRGRVGDYQ